MAKQRPEGSRELTLRIDADVHAIITTEALSRKRDKHVIVEEAIRHQKRIGLDAGIVALIETMATLQRQPPDLWLRDLLETRYEVLRPRDDSPPAELHVTLSDPKKPGRAP